MSSSDDIPVLERPAFFHYQRLTAGDLSAAQTYNRELRWLHNRSLHNWGIAFGFALSGPRGAQSVKVESGYAIDCVGRDLVLDKPLEIPVPAVASESDGSPATYYLTISYAEDAKLEAVNRAGECNTSGAVRLPEMPIVRWQDPNDANLESRYRQGFDVVLGAIRVLNCQLAEDVSGRERRDAVPPAQPYVASGQTELGNTPWQLWPNDNAPLGVATTVATSSAGFQLAPKYQAHVIGERMFQAAPGSETILVDGYSEIALATASRSLRVGQNLYTLIPFQQIAGQLVKNDFQSPLTKIATRNSVTRDALLDANGWTLNTVSVAIGQTIALPGPALHLNPKKVLKSSFMDVLKKNLLWYVVWMGVEG